MYKENGREELESCIHRERTKERARARERHGGRRKRERDAYTNVYNFILMNIYTLTAPPDAYARRDRKRKRLRRHREKGRRECV